MIPFGLRDHSCPFAVIFLPLLCLFAAILSLMLAVRKTARGIGNIEVIDVPEPNAGAGQVVLQVDSAGICGTDLHIYLDEFETYPPVTIGHETAGTIVELGPGVIRAAVGGRGDP